MDKTTIVMAYYNRRTQLIKTLESINKQNTTNLDIIVVDDVSDDIHKIDDINELFPKLDINVIVIEKKDKNWINPCIPFNIGIRKATGDIIMLQNPECMHVGNVIETIRNKITDKNYLCVQTYSFNKELTEKLDIDISVSDLYRLPQNASGDSFTLGWYNHKIYRDVFYHFCSAIKKSNMDRLNGFDESFKDGIGWDDAEFIHRIKKLPLQPIMIDGVSVIHQYHDNFNENSNSRLNKSLYNKKINR